jgi:hypothetical protein
MIFFTVPLVLAGGIAYRMRGSEFYANGLGSRPLKLAIGALPRAIGVWLVAPWQFALATWLLCAAADSLGHAQGQSFGSPGDNDRSQALKLLEAGVTSILPVLMALFFAWLIVDAPVPFLMPILVILGGAGEPAAYWLGWRTPAIGTQASPWYRRLLTGTEWAELYTGLLLTLFVLTA